MFDHETHYFGPLLLREGPNLLDYFCGTHPLNNKLDRVLSRNRRNFRPFVPKIPASRQQSYRALTTRLNPTGVDLSTNP